MGGWTLNVSPLDEVGPGFSSLHSFWISRPDATGSNRLDPDDQFHHDLGPKRWSA